MKETVSDKAREVRWRIPKVRCSMLKRVIGDFQRGPGWCMDGQERP